MGKIKSVTNANVAEFVAERKALGEGVKSPAELQGTEPTAIPSEHISEAKPMEAKEAEPEKPKEAKPKNSVQERIDELTRQRKEADEFAETEYELRMQLQRRMAELESQLQSHQPAPPKVEDEPAPDPAKYTDQQKFLDDWGAWNRKKAISEFKVEEAKRKQEEEKNRILAEANARREASLAAAREAFPDFDEVVKNADRAAAMKKIDAPTPVVSGLLSESDYQAHILRHLILHPEEVTKLNQMRPAQAAIAIGRLENLFAMNGKPVNEPTPKPKLPEPMAALGTGGGTAGTFDPSVPQPFTKYKEQRLAEIRRKRAARG